MADLKTDASSKLLAKLKKAGSAGLTPSRLLPAKSSSLRQVSEQILHDLQSQRVIGNLGTAKSPRYVLIEFFKPLEIACAAIEAKAATDKIALFTLNELAQGTKGAVRDKVPDAVHLLAREQKLIPIRRGTITYYLFTAPLRAALQLGSALNSPPTLDTSRVLQAYDQLVLRSGLPDVWICDLQRESGADLESLKTWLIEQSRQGRVAPSRGDWSLATPEQRSAALFINHEPFPRVRFLKT